MGEEQEPQVPGPSEEGLPLVRGCVKWFNAEKGFGFVIPDGGGDDVFLHLSALRHVGLEDIAGGATVVCSVSQGPKGLQAVRVTEVDVSSAQPTVRRRARSHLGFDRPRQDALAEVGELVDAEVKWFNPAKGYGFVTVGEDSPDVFVHMHTLRRCGLATLDPGQAVRIRIGQGARGPQVAEILAR